MSGGVLASSAGGTPKHGYSCHRCEDWGDIVEDEHGNPIAPVPCPGCRPAPCDRCGGTGTVTGAVGVGGALFVSDRACPAGCAPRVGNGVVP